MFRKNIGKDAALIKIKSYCSYQERSHTEVKEKLYSFGLYKMDVEPILSQLIEENFLNEERFALAFASGKFRIKKWGKVKIKHELKQKRVSEYCIKLALGSINEEDYGNMLKGLFESKLKSLSKERNSNLKKQKVYNYLLQKGFESNRITPLYISND